VGGGVGAGCRTLFDEQVVARAGARPWACNVGVGGHGGSRWEWALGGCERGRGGICTGERL
jgi:hypothetical protein